MARRGIALTPGQWISSGAVTGVHPVAPGAVVEARFDGTAYGELHDRGGASGKTDGQGEAKRWTEHGLKRATEARGRRGSAATAG